MAGADTIDFDLLRINEHDQLLLNAKLFNCIRDKKDDVTKIIKLKKYLDSGANINSRDANDKNNTILHIAAVRCGLTVIEFLLKNSACINFKNFNNETPTDIARRLNKQDIVVALEQSYLTISKQQDVNENYLSLTNKKGLLNKQEYAASGLKNTLHGDVYQLKLLMLYLKRGLDLGFDFLLSTEMVDAEKFDDLVFQYQDDSGSILYQFLQAKHKQDSSKQISSNDLLNVNDGEFSLLKYFTSYRKIKRNSIFKDGKIESFIICTNIDFKWDDEKGDLVFGSCFDRCEHDKFLYFRNNQNLSQYKFKPNFRGKQSLVQLLENASDIKRLAKKIVDVIEKDCKLDLREALFKEYHLALVEEKVIDIKNKMLHNYFIDNKNLTKVCQQFREYFLDFLSKTRKRKHGDLLINKTSWLDRAKSIKFTLSNTFGKYQNNITRPDDFVKRFVEILLECKNKDTSLVFIDKSEEILKLNIDNLVKDILIWNSDKIIFNMRIFEHQTKLEDDMKAFKELLIEELKALNIDKNHLFTLVFEIKDYPKVNLSSAQIVTIDEINDYLNNLVFAVKQPNEIEVGKLIQQEIGREFSFLESENDYNRFFVQMLDWMKEKRGRFLTQQDGQAFFARAKQGLSIWFEVNEPVKFFSGRKEELIKLHKHILLQKEVTVISNIICGLGGVGKSELCRKYIQIYSQDFDRNVIWINAESYDTIVQSFTRLASDNLNINIADNKGNAKDIKSIVEDVYKCFVKRRSLFIFDNALRYRSNLDTSGIDKFMPRLPNDANKPFILVTSRNQKWGVDNMLNLDVFTEAEGIDFIKKALAIENNDQDAAIKSLFQKLQGFPLALQQAVAFIRENHQASLNIVKSFTIDDYIKHFEDMVTMSNSQLLDYQFPEDSADLYTKTTFTTWRITIDRIRKYEFGKQAIAILNMIAYCAPDNIPVLMFLSSKVINNDENILSKAVQLLKQYSMVKSPNDQTLINIHRLVQHVSRIELGEVNQERDVLNETLEILQNCSLEKNVLNHATVIWNSNKHVALAIKFKTLPSQITSSLCQFVRYEEAYLFASKALNYLSHIIDCDDISVLLLDHCLADVLHKQSKFREALDKYQYVAGRRTLVLGENHPETLKSIHGLAWMKDRLLNYKDALDTFEIILDKRNNLYTQTKDENIYRDILETNDRIGWIYINLGKYKAAIEILKNNYERKCTAKTDHSGVLYTQQVLAIAYSHDNQHKNALEIFKEVQSKREDLLGKNHPDTLDTMHHVASEFSCLEEYEKAISSYQDVYQNRRFVLGDNHSDTLDTLHEIGVNRYNLEGYQEALEIFNEVFEKRKQFIGHDQATIHVKHRTAMTLNEMDRIQECFDCYKEVYHLRLKYLGIDAPRTLNTLQNLVLLFNKTKNLDIIKFLANENANFNVLLNNRYTPFTLVARCDNFEAIRIELDHGAQVSNKDSDGRNALHIICSNGHIHVLQDIVNYHSSNNKDIINLCLIDKDNKGRTPFHHAAMNDHFSILQFLLDLIQQIHPDQLYQIINECVDGNTALHWSYINGNVEMAKYLIIDKNAVINENSNNSNIMHLAALNGNLSVVEFTAQNFPRIDSNQLIEMIIAKNKIGNTPIDYAIKKGHNDLVKYLLNICDKYPIDNALETACRSGKFEIVQYLVDIKGANISAKNQHDSIIHQAISSNNIDMIEYLLNKIALSEQFSNYINHQDGDGDTPLMWTAEKGKIEAATILLKYGALLNIKNQVGDTALNWTANKNNWDMCVMLLRKGADIKELDDQQRQLLANHIYDQQNQDEYDDILERLNLLSIK